MLEKVGIWKKKEKVRLIYARCRESGGIMAYVWGKRDLETAKKLKERIKERGISYDRIATDNGDSFLSAFAEGPDKAGKERAAGAGIKGNNCRVRRVFWRACRFSKKLSFHN
jgi:IS1 family transposase